MGYDYLTEKIIKAAYKVHNVLGKGFMEKVYQNAMFIELIDMGLSKIKKAVPGAVSSLYLRRIPGTYISTLSSARKYLSDATS